MRFVEINSAIVGRSGILCVWLAGNEMDFQMHLRAYANRNRLNCETKSSKQHLTHDLMPPNFSLCCVFVGRMRPPPPLLIPFQIQNTIIFCVTLDLSPSLSFALLICSLFIRASLLGPVIIVHITAMAMPCEA